jgi:hypothetical protein
VVEAEFRVALRVFEVQVRQRFPTASETDDLHVVLAAAVRNCFYDRVEVWDVAPTSEDADSLFRHSTPLLTQHLPPRLQKQD